MAALLVGLTVSTSASARDFRVDDIPNGAVKKCRNCHLDDDGKSFTPFGSDARLYLEGNVPTEKMHVNWQKLYARDSDADGYTNGQELADPTGVWTPGQPNPKGPTSNPGDDASVLPPICNNGKLDPHEPCEGAMMSVTNCSELNAGDGVLACTAQCQFDKSGCSNPGAAGGAASFDDSGAGCVVSVSNPSSEERAGTGNRGALGVDAVWIIALSVVAARRAKGSAARHSQDRARPETK